MVGSVKKVKVALKSAKICSSSHVPNSILKNAPKWLVYADTVTYATPVETSLLLLSKQVLQYWHYSPLIDVRGVFADDDHQSLLLETGFRKPLTSLTCDDKPTIKTALRDYHTLVKQSLKWINLLMD